MGSGSNKRDVWESELFVFEGATRDELQHRLSTFHGELVQQSGARLGDVAAAVNGALNAAPSGVRLAIVASSFEQLTNRLTRAVEKLASPKCVRIREVTGLYFEAEPLYRTGGLALLFPGEGAQFPGMLTGLPQAFPLVRKIFSQCEELATADNGPGTGLLTRLVTPSEIPNGNALNAVASDFSTDIFTVAIANWVLGELANHFGVLPDAVAGHSAGEMSALCHVGAIDSEEVIAIAKSMHSMDSSVAQQQDPAALLALGTSREKAEAVVDAAQLPTTSSGDPSAFVAMDNCPHQTVIVGLPAAIASIEADLNTKSMIYERLDLDRPYHTPLFEPFMAPLREIFRTVSIRLPRFKLYSCTTGLPFPQDTETIKKMAVDHWVSTVEFTKMIGQMHDDGVRVFLEVGPRGNLSAFAEDILRGKPAAVIPFNVPRISPLSQINHALARLAVHGVPVRLDRLHADRDVHPIQPPEESLERKIVGDVAATPKARTPRALLTRRRPTPVGEVSVIGQYQSVMQQFLRLQQDVMTDYLSHRKRPPARRTRRRANRRSQRAEVIGGMTAAPATVVSSQHPPASTGCATFGGPLLGDIVEHVAGRKLVMRRRLALDDDLYADHHTVGGQRISRVDPNQHGMPVMPMTFTLETMAEAALRLVPGMVVVSLRDVRLQKWLAFYDDDPVSIELTAEVVSPEELPKPIKANLTPDEIVVQVQIRDLGNSGTGPGAEGGDAAAGHIVLGAHYPAAPALAPFKFTNPRACRISLEYLYDNLFHGPLFQGVQSLDRYGDREILGTVEVLPRAGLLAKNDCPSFLLDPVTLDTTMHPLAGWHLEQPDQSGRIMLPFALDRIDFYAPCPKVGERLTCRGRLRKQTPRYVVQDLDVVDTRGHLRWRMSGIRLWRFYLPFDGVNFHGPKDVYFLSSEWPEAAPASDHSSCVRFDSPADLMQPAILWAASKVMLSPKEQRAFAKLQGTTADKAAWMFSRAACKDATRKLLLRQSDRRMFVADIEVDDSDSDAWKTVARDRQSTDLFPRVSVAHENGHFVAVATLVGTPHVAISAANPRLPELTPHEMAIIRDASGDESLDRWPITVAKRLATELSGSSAIHLTDVTSSGVMTFRMETGTELTVTTSQADGLVVATAVVA